MLGASQHNLKGIDVEFPVGKFVAVTGVSGSGKSTLVNEIVYKALANRLHRMRDEAGRARGGRGDRGVRQGDRHRPVADRPHAALEPGDVHRSCSTTSASSTRSRPRRRCAATSPGRFSFNVHGGRCEACKGDGQIKIEMHFLPDVYVPCETCKGERYNRETLEVRFKGKSIADVLEMSVEEALEFFAKIPKLRRRLQTLHDVGLDYIKLGQPATTLSGGEAQRVKLAAELCKVATGGRCTSSTSRRPGCTSRTSRSCSRCCSGWSTAGNTVLVIEHNLDVIKQADWIIDLGPEGGEAGGEVIATGTPEQIAEVRRVVHGPVPARGAAEAKAPGAEPKPRRSGSPERGAATSRRADPWAMRLLSLVLAVTALAGCAGGPEATQAYDLLQRAQVAQAQVSSVSYEAKASFSVQGQTFGYAFKGAALLKGASAGDQWIEMTSHDPGVGPISMMLVRRGSRMTIRSMGRTQDPIPAELRRSRRPGGRSTRST